MAKHRSLTFYSENDSPGFKLDIRSNPIQEEGADSEEVLSNVASRLRDVKFPIIIRDSELTFQQSLL